MWRVSRLAAEIRAAYAARLRRDKRVVPLLPLAPPQLKRVEALPQGGQNPAPFHRRLRNSRYRVYLARENSAMTPL